jgi:hypothetical protein
LEDNRLKYRSLVRLIVQNHLTVNVSQLSSMKREGGEGGGGRNE